MPGTFDVDEQHDDVDSKLIAALERLGQALRVMLWEAAKREGLSPIQVQILVHLRYHQNNRLSDLARHFDLTKATLSEAVKTLEDKRLLSRVPNPTDARAAYLQLSPQGQERVQKLETWAERAKENLGGLQKNAKTEALLLLMKLIEALQKAEVITVARMCTTCRFLREQGSRYYCTLLDKPLKAKTLRVDCPDHQQAP